MVSQRSLSVLIGEDKPGDQYALQKILSALGHRVTGVAGNGQSLVEMARSLRPDLVIADVRMPGTDGLEAAQALCGELPVLVVSAYQEEELLDRAGACPNVLAYLAKPITPEALRPAIALILRRFEEVTTLRKEATDLRQALEDRKLVERAKGVVMRRLVLDEAEAFRRFKKHAADRNQKLRELAGQLLEADQVFRELEKLGDGRGGEGRGRPYPPGFTPGPPPG